MISALGCSLGLIPKCTLAEKRNPIFANGTSALVGHTGFVGSNILAKASFDAHYNSKTISEIRGKQYDLCVIAAVSGLKWQANRHPEKDRANIEALTDHLQYAKCGWLVLISTISVYDKTSGEVDESRDVWSTATEAAANSNRVDADIFSRGYTPYGVHRAQLEAWVRDQTGEHMPFGRTLVVRLPGLFGCNLSKNYLYDLVVESDYIHKIDLATSHQWYPLAWLASDISTILHHAQFANFDSVLVVNLFPQPVPTATLVASLAPHLQAKCKQHKGGDFNFVDDVKTRHSDLFKDSGAPGYRFSKEQSLKQLQRFFDDSRRITHWHDGLRT